jgi:hypothetical protein
MLVGVLTTGLISSSFVADLSAASQSIHEGNITYISGDIGSDEEQAIKSEAKDYDLRVSSATKAGDFIADTSFVIKSENGHEMIRADNTGPLFYAKLPAGEYIIEASVGEQKKIRDIKISDRHPVDMHLIWQS